MKNQETIWKEKFIAANEEYGKLRNKLEIRENEIARLKNIIINIQGWLAENKDMADTMIRIVKD